MKRNKNTTLRIVSIRGLIKIRRLPSNVLYGTFLRICRSSHVSVIRGKRRASVSRYDNVPQCRTKRLYKFCEMTQRTATSWHKQHLQMQNLTRFKKGRTSVDNSYNREGVAAARGLCAVTGTDYSWNGWRSMNLLRLVYGRSSLLRIWQWGVLNVSTSFGS